MCLVVFAPASLVGLLLRDAGRHAGESRPARCGADPATSASPARSSAASPGRSRRRAAERRTLGFDVDLTGDAARSQRTHHGVVSATAHADCRRNPRHGTAERVCCALRPRTSPVADRSRTTRLTAAYGARLPNVRGELKWSGGNVAYRLSGRDHRVDAAAARRTSSTRQSGAARR